MKNKKKNSLSYLGAFDQSWIGHDFHFQSFQKTSSLSATAIFNYFNFETHISLNLNKKNLHWPRNRGGQNFFISLMLHKDHNHENYFFLPRNMLNGEVVKEWERENNGEVVRNEREIWWCEVMSVNMYLLFWAVGSFWTVMIETLRET